MDILQVDSPLRLKVEDVRHDYQRFMPLFSVYQNLFKILVKFNLRDDEQPEAAVLGQQGSSASGLLDVYRYGWLFILYFSGIYIEDLYRFDLH